MSPNKGFNRTSSFSSTTMATRVPTGMSLVPSPTKIFAKYPSSCATAFRPCDASTADGLLVSLKHSPAASLRLCRDADPLWICHSLSIGPPAILFAHSCRRDPKLEAEVRGLATIMWPMAPGPPSPWWPCRSPPPPAHRRPRSPRPRPSSRMRCCPAELTQQHSCQISLVSRKTVHLIIIHLANTVWVASHERAHYCVRHTLDRALTDRVED